MKRIGMSRNEIQLARVLAHLGLIPERTPIAIHRTYAGRHQRAGGAWVWWASRADDLREIAGSIFPVGLVLFAFRVGPSKVSLAMNEAHPSNGVEIDPATILQWYLTRGPR